MNSTLIFEKHAVESRSLLNLKSKIMITQFFKRFFGNKANTESDFSKEELIDMNVCPNCWGRQEYQDEYKQFVFDKTKSNISHDKAHQKAFIEQFVETHVTGIKLKANEDRLNCPKCNTQFGH